MSTYNPPFGAEPRSASHPSGAAGCVDQFFLAVGGRRLKRPLIREDLKVIQYQSQEADNTFIQSIKLRAKTFSGSPSKKLREL